MNNIIKKGLAVAVIILFIGLAFASSVNANMSEIQEYKYEDCDCISESDSKYLVICSLLSLLFYPIYLFTIVSPFDLMYMLVGLPIYLLAVSLDCSWTNIPEPKIQGMINSNYSTEIYKTLSEAKIEN